MARREGPHRFGWCADGQHDECKVEVTVRREGKGYDREKYTRTYQCECQCHTEAGLPW